MGPSFWPILSLAIIMIWRRGWQSLKDVDVLLTWSSINSSNQFDNPKEIWFHAGIMMPTFFEQCLRSLACHFQWYSGNWMNSSIAGYDEMKFLGFCWVRTIRNSQWCSGTSRATPSRIRRGGMWCQGSNSGKQLHVLNHATHVSLNTVPPPVPQYLNFKGFWGLENKALPCMSKTMGFYPDSIWPLPLALWPKRPLSTASVASA